ncbi:MAG: ATP-dependent helicase [Phycisphaerales bacterium]|nr:MAG: ATP-dependent helicase [Phycisphaerales bacterium]
MLGMIEAAAGAPRFLRGLNDDQRRAVLHDDGPVAVLAGPGSGKTRVITHRVGRLVAPVEEGGAGAAPESVLALAFTIKSAEELRSRLREMVEAPGVADAVRAGTIHAFGRRIVRRFADVLGMPPEPEIIDSAQRRRLLREIIVDGKLFADQRALGVDAFIALGVDFIAKCRNDAVDARRCAAWIEERRRVLDDGTHGLDDEALAAERAQLPVDADLAELYARFERACVRRGWITLDDYITLPIRILRESERARAIMRDEIRHIVVDEFQDWNPAQIELLKLIAPAGAGVDLCVVGDDDQSIYAFRGADDRAFQRFSAHWSEHVTVTLARNYRSAPAIIAAANAVIGRAGDRFAPDKAIEADPDRAPAPGEGVEGVDIANDNHAGAVIAASILDDRRANPERPWSSYAVIVRTNAYLDSVGAELEVHGLPVVRRRILTPLDDQGVQDALAWMRLIVDPDDAPSIKRLLVRRPFITPIDDATAWINAHRAARADGDRTPLGVWLLSHTDDRARRLAEILRDLRISAATSTADAVALEVIRLSGVAHTETLPREERASRIVHLAAMLRFIRSRISRLDAPADIAAFWSYYNDLDDDERQFRVRGEEQVDHDGGEDGEDRPDAVTLLTAHSAKGLQFDTVYVPRVRPGHGYPKSNRADDAPPLPESLTGRAPPNHDDEERRLFYVACTRAQRRLVLLAKSKKNTKEQENDYFLTLTRHEPGLTIPVHDGQDILARAGLAPADEMEGEAGAAAQGSPVGRVRRAWIDREAARIRAEAGAALFDADRADITQEGAEAVAQTLRWCALRLATLARLRTADSSPPEAPDPSESTNAAGVARLPASGVVPADDPLAADLRAYEATARAVGAGGDAHELLRPMKPPIYLSYTKVSDYLRCPRCFYFKYVLRLDEPKTAQLFTGHIAHQALEQYYNEVRNAESDGAPVPPVERLLAIADATLEREWSGHIERDETKIEQLHAQLRNAHAMHEPDALILDVERSVRFAYRCDGVDHPFIAKIDRIDQLADGRMRIVDYKTGHATKKLTEPPRSDLQMCIYALALRHERGDEDVSDGLAEYWALSTGERGVISFADLDLEKARAEIDKAIRGMLAGEFPSNAGNSYNCRGLCTSLGDLG